MTAVDWKGLSPTNVFIGGNGRRYGNIWDGAALAGIARPLLAALPADRPVAGVNMAGTTTPRGGAGPGRFSDATLAVENGAMHMAVALGKPCAAVCGPGWGQRAVGRFAPYPRHVPRTRRIFGKCPRSGCGWHCDSKRACALGMPPADVAEAAERVTAGLPPRARQETT